MSGPSNPSALSVLLDVEMPLTLRFGRARLRLDEILHLDTDSLVELDRTPHEAVDVMVNGRVVARGNVVCVEGNYGVRISEVVSRGERLNTTVGAV